MKQLPNHTPKPKKTKKSWIPLAVFALVCNAVIVYVYINNHKNNKADLTVNNNASNKVSTNPNLAIEAFPQSQPNESDISTENQNNSSTITTAKDIGNTENTVDVNNAETKEFDIQTNKPMSAIMVKKTSSLDEEHTDKSDKPDSSETTDKNSENTNNKTLTTASTDKQTANKNDQEAIKEAKATQTTTTNNKKSETTLTNNAQNKTNTTAKPASESNKDDAQSPLSTTTASAKKPASPISKANNNNQTKSKPSTNKSTRDSAGVDWQIQYDNVTGSKPISTAPVRHRPTEQEIQDASLLAIDLPASQRRKIPTNSSATRELQAKTNAVKSNTEALQGQLSDTIRSIKDINQQKIERDRQMAQRAYDDLQRMNQLKQQQDLAGQIDTTETQLEQSTINNPPKPK